MASDKEIKVLFIREILDQHAEFLIDLFSETLEANKIYKSGELLDGINYQIRTFSDSTDLLISFPSYGRFIEIRYNRIKNKKNVFHVDTNRELFGVKSNAFAPKNVNWYSRNAYGSINRLISMLSYEFSDQEISRLKGILSNTKTENWRIWL